MGSGPGPVIMSLWVMLAMWTNLVIYSKLLTIILMKCFVQIVDLNGKNNADTYTISAIASL